MSSASQKGSAAGQAGELTHALSLLLSRSPASGHTRGGGGIPAPPCTRPSGDRAGAVPGERQAGPMGVRARRSRGQRLPDRGRGRRVPPEARRAAEARGPAAARAFPEPSRTSPRRRPNLSEPTRAVAEPPRAAPPRVRAPDQLGARPESRGARVEGHGALTMELSESVQRGIQKLADPGSFDSNAFALLLRAAFQSLLDARADEAALGKRLSRRRGLGGGAPGRAASPAPWAQLRPGQVPGLRRPSVRLWGTGAGPERRCAPAGHLHAASSTLLAWFSCQTVSLFLCKAVFKSSLWPKRVGFSASSEGGCSCCDTWTSAGEVL